MIEIKLSQGAKPAHGGLLPGAKVTPTIAEARGVEVGEDCNSPARHSAFNGPVEMMQFAQKLRELRWGRAASTAWTALPHVRPFLTLFDPLPALLCSALPCPALPVLRVA